MGFQTIAKMLISIILLSTFSYAKKVTVKVVGIPLADHYAAIVAYEKYTKHMQKANFELKLLSGPNLVRRYFRSMPDTDMALNVVPMVLDMFAKKPDFRWISLMHRDGNALVVNNLLAQKLNIHLNKSDTITHSTFAHAIKDYAKKNTHPIEIAIPSLLATHTTILYKYLKDHNLTMQLYSNKHHVKLHIVKPPHSIAYLKSNNHRQIPVAFEQSLPWPQIIQSQGDGQIVWYSKDVMRHEKGHVECIVIAKDESITHKAEAIKEIIYYIHKAAQDIENARKDPKALQGIIKMIQKHIPAHTSKAISQSLASDTMGINYRNLNVDNNAKKSLKKIMELALEAGFIQKRVDIEALADERFASDIMPIRESKHEK